MRLHLKRLHCAFLLAWKCFPLANCSRGLVIRYLEGARSWPYVFISTISFKAALSTLQIRTTLENLCYCMPLTSVTFLWISHLQHSVNGTYPLFERLFLNRINCWKISSILHAATHGEMQTITVNAFTPLAKARNRWDMRALLFHLVSPCSSCDAVTMKIWGL